jgi:hypothetical protein
MAKKKAVKVIQKGERCGTGWERLTIKYGRKTFRACVRKGTKKKEARKRSPWWFRAAHITDIVNLLP